MTQPSFAECMASADFEIQSLIKSYPPLYRNEHKKRLYLKALELFNKQQESVGVSRWRFDKSGADEGALCEKRPVKIETRDDYFCYDESDSDGERVFYLNYADPNLFGYYDTDMFAQDEIQTLEHPLLGAVSECIEAVGIAGMRGLTVEKKEPTPFVVLGAPQWLSVDTNPVMPDGSRRRLYGWMLSESETQVVDAGIKPLGQDRRNNILAVAAPECGRGEYTKEQIVFIMKTLLAGFGAAARISEQGGKKSCAIHTGRWGCGAFGNSEELMLLAQIVAASMTGVSRLLFHAVSADALAAAQEKFSALPERLSLGGAVDFLLEQRYRWGKTDGN